MWPKISLGCVKFQSAVGNLLTIVYFRNGMPVSQWHTCLESLVIAWKYCISHLLGMLCNHCYLLLHCSVTVLFCKKFNA